MRFEIAPELRERVEVTLVIYQCLIVEELARLVLFTAPMMINGKDNGFCRSCSFCQPQRRQPAVTANLQKRSYQCALRRPFQQLQRLFLRQEALYAVKLCCAHGRLPAKASVYDVSLGSS